MRNDRTERQSCGRTGAVGRPRFAVFYQVLMALLCICLMMAAAAARPAFAEEAVVADSGAEDAIVPAPDQTAENTDVLSLDGLIEVTGEEAGTADASQADGSAKQNEKKERRLVVGYKTVGLLQSVEFEMGEKPSLSSLLAQFPTQLEVYFLGEKKAQTVPVTWRSIGDDYESTNLNFYYFTPKFDETRYQVRGLNLQADAPYIEVIQRALTFEMIDSAPPKVNEAAVYRYCREILGLNNAAACGILANIYCESGFRTNAIGDSGTSVGICQWHNSRWTNLKAYAPHDWQALKGQLRFMAMELRTGYRGTLEYLRNVPDTAQGAYNAGCYWCLHYEMPDRMVSRGMTRGYLARNVYWQRYGISQEGGEQDAAMDDARAGTYRCTSDDGLLIRSEPTTQSASVGFIPFDERVTVSRGSDTWAAVRYGDTEGYSSMEFLERVEE